jgi:WD40 repeat protein
MAFSPDGKYLASGHGWIEREGSIQVWEVKSGKRVGLEMLSIGVSSIAWTPDGKQIAASIWDSTVRIYAFPGLQQKTRIAIDRSASRLGISPDGKQIVTAAEGYSPFDDSQGRVVQIWDVATGARVRKCESEENLFRMGCAAWSPQGKYVAAAGGNYSKDPKGLARLWFADTGKEAALLEGHARYILGIRFFPDDSRVATAGIFEEVGRWVLIRFMVKDGIELSSYCCTASWERCPTADAHDAAGAANMGPGSRTRV